MKVSVVEYAWMAGTNASKFLSAGYWLLAFFIFTTIFERFNVFISSLGFSLKISLLILPVLALVLLFSRKLLFNPTGFFPALAGVFLAQVLSLLFSFDRTQSLQVSGFTVLMMGLFYLLVWTGVARKQEFPEKDPLTPWIWTWGLGALLVSLLGIGQFWLHFKGIDPSLTFDSWFPSARTLPVGTFTESLWGIFKYRILWEWKISDILRPSSTFIDVNTAASYVGIFLILGSGWLLTYLKDIREKFSLDRVLPVLGLGGMLLVSLVYFFLTLSRSAALGLGVGLAVLLFFLLKDKFGTKLVGAVLALLILGSSVAGFNLSYARREGSSLERVEYARAAWDMFKTNPISGVGVGNFEPYCLTVLRPDLPACYSHSIFLTWLGELGILGILANLSLIGLVFYFGFKLLNTLSRDRNVYIRLASLLAGFAVLTFANIFHAHYGLDFTWVLLGLLTVGYYLAKKEATGVYTSVDILGVRVDNVTMEETVLRIKELFKSKKKSYVVTPNPEFIITASKDKEFTHILNGADLSIPDGAGLVWASRIWGRPLKARVTGVGLFWQICAESARRGGRIFLLGAAPGVAEKTAQIIKKMFPKIKVSGTFAGNGLPAGDRETTRQVNQAAHQPIDILFVAYGHGKQERWIKRNLKKVNVKVAVGVGGTFDYVAGRVPLAPAGLRKLGLEWLYRLLKEPWRFKRQWSLVPFSILTFKEAFRR